METVRVRLAGGLGNQLFQLHAGYLLAERTNRHLILDDRFLRFEPGYVFRQRMGLKQIGLRSFVRNIEFTPPLKISRLSALEKFKEKIFDSLGIIEVRNYFGEFGTQLQVENFTKNSTKREILIKGNIQSTRFSVMSLDLGIKKYFNIKDLGLTDPSKPIVINIRLADYVLPGNEKYRLGRTYYQSCLNKIRGKFPYNPIWLFSDEPSIAIEYLTPSQQKLVALVSDPKKNTEISELTKMSQGAAHILANSTFSYWGALLSNSDYVLAPSPWFKGPDKVSFPEFDFPDTWTKVKW
jgi:Glycosyl transferase family 11